MGTLTRKLGRLLRPVKGVDAASDPPKIRGVMVAKDVTKFEGVVGIGIVYDNGFTNVGVLAFASDL